MKRMFACVSCTKDDVDKSSFSIYGEWGMLDGTIVDEEAGIYARYYF